MSEWLARALAEHPRVPNVPIVPKTPKAPSGGSFGTIGTNGTGGWYPCWPDFDTFGTFGTTGAFATPPTDKPEFDWTAFCERAAALEFECGLARAEAEESAAREAGYSSVDALAADIVAFWAMKLTEVSAFGLCQEGAKYVLNAQNFIADGWAQKALCLGWTEPQLIWADGVEPWRRYDNLGAAYLTRDIVFVDADEIGCAVKNGPPLRIHRDGGDGRRMPPWDRLSSYRPIEKPDFPAIQE